MKNTLKKIINTAGLVFAMLLFFANVPAAAEITVKPQYMQTDARAMLSDINKLRTGSDAWYWNASSTSKIYEKNLKPLTYDYALEKIAMQRAAEIAVSYSHTRPNGSSCFTAYDDFGYDWYSVGENIAAGFTNRSDVFTAWAEADKKYELQGHRRNMLGSRFNAVGIGHAYFNGFHFWVQVFSDAPRGTAKTTACNTVKAAKVNVAPSYVTNKKVSVAESAINVAFGGTQSLPTAKGEMVLSGTWPNRMFEVEETLTWKSANTTYAGVSGNKVSGKKVGSTTLTANGITGTAKVNVTIQKTSLAGASITLASSKVSYTGSAVKPTISSVKVNGKTLVSGKDYKVTGTGSKEIGKASLTIEGIGNYNGKASVSYEITAPKTALSKVTSVTGSKLNVKWVKRAGVDGYQIKYTTGTKTLAVTVKGANTVNANIKNLTMGKTYKVAIRSYVVKGGQKYYSDWSAAKSVKIVR